MPRLATRVYHDRLYVTSETSLSNARRQATSDGALLCVGVASAISVTGCQCALVLNANG